MKILVTGGCGFIGSAVVRMAIERGFSVVNVDSLTYAANPANVAAVANNTDYAFEHADIRDAKRMANVFSEHRPDAVMHLAAESHVDRSIDGPLDFVDSNVLGTATLLQSCREYLATRPDEDRAKFKFIHVSTDEVYGSLGPTGKFSETSPHRPNSPYSASKAASDMMVRAWHQTYGFPALISNCSNNYGPFQYPEKLIPVAILAASAGKMIPVYGQGLNIRDWIYVDDHADALLTLLDRGRVGEVYNIGGDAEWTNIDLVRLLCRELDLVMPGSAPHDQLISFVTDRPGHDHRYAVDSGKMHTELGWAPKMTIQDGIKATVRWYVDHQDWCHDSLRRNTDLTTPTRMGLIP